MVYVRPASSAKLALERSLRAVAVLVAGAARSSSSALGVEFYNWFVGAPFGALGAPIQASNPA
jgi:hypothetical protein